MKKSQILNQKEKDMIQEFMYSSYDNLKLNQDIKTILSKDLSNLKKNKLILEAITYIIYKMGNNPLITQKELLKKLNSKLETNLTLDEFKHANHQIRESQIAQDMIVNYGLGKKYWKNTIIPISNSGSIKNTLEKKVNYPFRVGIYPGLSCMFECVFCGRNYKAKYERSSLDDGIEKYMKLIDEAPIDDKYRFYISGGLEPLTNPKLGEIINKLKSRDFKVPLYTNAFMLSEKYLNKQNGLEKLDSIRVSIYGMDEKKYFETTKKPNAYKIVTQNIINLIQYKEKNNLEFDIGLNYIILENSSDDVIKILNYIKFINSQVGNNKNNLQFLTLREDFRCTQSLRMSDNERKKLKNILEKFDIMMKEEKLLQNLMVDFGYSLEPIKNGYTDGKFESVFATKEMLLSEGTPNISVAIDLYGDVYGYREAAFLDRPGSKRYILGRVNNDNLPFEKIISDALTKKRFVDVKETDLDYLDAWDHIVLRTLDQAKKDKEFGIPFEIGPVIGRSFLSNKKLENFRTHFSNPNN